MTTRSFLTTAFVSGALLGLSGCVKPDPANPWSTKSQSRASLVSNQGANPPSAGSVGEARDSTGSGEEMVRVRPADVVSLSAADSGMDLKTSDGVPKISLSARARAQSILMMAVNDEHPLLRAIGFQGLEWMPQSLGEVAPSGLSDENQGVRFVTAMTVGQAKLAGMQLYLEPLLLDESKSVHAAAIFALRQLGEQVDPSPLGQYVLSNDPEVRSNAYIVLGRLGNASAIPLIQSSLGKGMRLVNPMRVKLTELQAADSLVELGDESEVEPIRAALFAPVEQGELSILACEFLGEIGDGQARPMLHRLLAASGRQQRPLEIRIAAAKALFQLGEPLSSGLEGVIMLGVKNEDQRLRIQAAASLAVVPGDHAESVLLEMLSDPDPLVATTAAAAIARRMAISMGQ